MRVLPSAPCSLTCLQGPRACGGVRCPAPHRLPGRGDPESPALQAQEQSHRDSGLTVRTSELHWQTDGSPDRPHTWLSFVVVVDVVTLAKTNLGT